MRGAIRRGDHRLTVERHGACGTARRVSRTRHLCPHGTSAMGSCGVMIARYPPSNTANQAVAGHLTWLAAASGAQNQWSAAA